MLLNKASTWPGRHLLAAGKAITELQLASASQLASI